VIKFIADSYRTRRAVSRAETQAIWWYLVRELFEFRHVQLQ
jgi:hypothetical protein